MTLEQQYEEFVKQGFDHKKEFLAYSVGKKNVNGAFLIDPIVSSRADGQTEFSLRRFPMNQKKYTMEMGYELYSPPAPKKAAAKSTTKKDEK